MHYQIRPFTGDDYPALCTVWNSVYPGEPETPEEWRYEDEHRDPKCKWVRWVVEASGRLVATGHYSQSSDYYHPQKFYLNIVVLPEVQGRGLGKALYHHVMAALQPFDPLTIRASTREDWARSVRFLTDRSFQENMREWESDLTVAAFDAAPYAGLEERLQAQGVSITTMTALAADPNRDRKLHTLNEELLQEVPAPEPRTPASFEQFVAQTLHHPNLLPDGLFVAVCAGEYVGLSSLWASPAEPRMLSTGLTGVRQGYRRRGIALALKLQAIVYAQAHSATTIKTWNESHNRPMLAINERLGFVRQPAWIKFARPYMLPA